jgi:hypothetical protein
MIDLEYGQVIKEWGRSSSRNITYIYNFKVCLLDQDLFLCGRREYEENK